MPYMQIEIGWVSEETLVNAEHVLGTSDGRKYLSGDDRIYISGEHTHQEWGIYRVVSRFERDGLGETMVALRLVATATLAQTGKEHSGLSVVSQQQEILLNDIVLPEVGLDKLSLSRTFYPGPAKKHMTANVLGSIEGIKYTARNQVVVIGPWYFMTRCAKAQCLIWLKRALRVYGDAGEFSYESQGIGNGVQLPEAMVGSLMVIRPYRILQSRYHYL